MELNCLNCTHKRKYEIQESEYGEKYSMESCGNVDSDNYQVEVNYDRVCSDHSLDPDFLLG